MARPLSFLRTTALLFFGFVGCWSITYIHTWMARRVGDQLWSWRKLVFHHQSSSSFIKKGPIWINKYMPEIEPNKLYHWSNLCRTLFSPNHFSGSRWSIFYLKSFSQKPPSFFLTYRILFFLFFFQYRVQNPDRTALATQPPGDMDLEWFIMVSYRTTDRA